MLFLINSLWSFLQVLGLSEVLVRLIAFNASSSSSITFYFTAVLCKSTTSSSSYDTPDTPPVTSLAASVYILGSSRAFATFSNT